MIVGHKKQLDYLNHLVKSDRLPHALLFAGQEKLGKKTVAVEWISEIFNQNLFEKTHPDFVMVEPKEKEIQIDQIRDLTQSLSLKPFLAPLKAVVIDQAHLMNWQAQNSFLKTLEEPKGRTLLILVSEHSASLFSTILSRVQKVKFYPVAKTEIISYLEKKSVLKEKAKEIADLSLGSPGKAIDFAFDSGKLESHYAKLKEIEKILESDLPFRFNYAKDLSGKDDLRETLNIWVSHLRSILLDKLGGAARMENYSPFKLKKLIEKTQETNFLLSSTNANPRLVLETLMLEF